MGKAWKKKHPGLTKAAFRKWLEGADKPPPSPPKRGRWVPVRVSQKIKAKTVMTDSERLYKERRRARKTI